MSTFSGDGHFKMTDSTPRLSVKVAAWTATPWDDGSGIQVLLGLYPIVTNFAVQLEQPLYTRFHTLYTIQSLFF